MNKLSICLIRLIFLSQAILFGQGFTSITFKMKNIDINDSSNINVKKLKIFNTLNKIDSKVKIERKYKGTKINYLKQFYTITTDSHHVKKIKEDLRINKINLEVDSITIDPLPIPTYNPSDAMWSNASRRPIEGWHIDNLNLPNAWNITRGDPNVRIAIVDSDFDVAHPDLVNRILFNTDLSSNANLFTNTPQDHGTRVAYCAIGQVDGGGDGLGSGFNCRVVGYDWADGVDKAHDASLLHNARIINISWHYECDINNIPNHTRVAIREILDNGTVIVASAGNGNCNFGPTYPFSALIDDRIIVVTSHGADNNHTYFSFICSCNTHFSGYPSVDISAPGYDVVTAMRHIDPNTNQPITYPYIRNWGTSFSSPLVAGVVGLMISANPCLNALEVNNIIRNSGNPIADANLYPNQLGGGRLDAYRAVKASVTNYFQNRIVNTQITNRAFVDIGSNVTPTLTQGPVSQATNSNWAINSREVIVNGDFTVPVGAELTITTNANHPLGCP